MKPIIRRRPRYKRAPLQPEHLDKLVDLPPTVQAHRAIDRWIWYCELEALDGGLR